MLGCANACRKRWCWNRKCSEAATEEFPGNDATLAKVTAPDRIEHAPKEVTEERQPAEDEELVPFGQGLFDHSPDTYRQPAAGPVDPDYPLGPRSAIYITSQQATPKHPVIDESACIHLQTGLFEAASLHFTKVAELCYVLEPRAVVDALTGLVLSQQLMGRSDEAEK